MLLGGRHLWDSRVLIARVLLKDMVLVASVLNGSILRANMKVVVQ